MSVHGGLGFEVEVALDDGRILTFMVMAASHDDAEDIAIEYALEYSERHPLAVLSAVA